MTRRLDQILVVDVESTCWEGAPPEGEEHEIIEIGVCLLDVQTLQRLDKVSILVQPERSRLSEYCSALTTLTHDQLDRGVPLAEACRILRDRYHSKQRLWASYGDYDRHQFEHECRERNIDYPFGRGHINVKSLFAVVQGMSREVSMDRALELLHHPLEGTHHRGADDAWNIALILAHIIGRARRTG